LDESLKMPLIVRSPSRIGAGTVNDAFVDGLIEIRL